MKYHSASKLGQVITLGDALQAAALEIARVAQNHFRATPRSRGATVRPGSATPLWLALMVAVRPHLHRRGEKSLLARELGLDPSRVTEFFVRGTAMPDAERTLLLLEWLGRRPRGK